MAHCLTWMLNSSLTLLIICTLLRPGATSKPLSYSMPTVALRLFTNTHGTYEPSPASGYRSVVLILWKCSVSFRIFCPYCISCIFDCPVNSCMFKKISRFPVFLLTWLVIIMLIDNITEMYRCCIIGLCIYHSFFSFCSWTVA